MDFPAREDHDFELPNVRAIVDSHQVIAVELSKMQNIPAFDAGAAIITEIRAMREQIREQSVKMGLELNVMEANNVARHVNSTLADADAALSPLQCVVNNEIVAVAGFPRTPRDIGVMTVAEMNVVFRAFGMALGGTAARKRQELRVKVGLRAEPV